MKLKKINPLLEKALAENGFGEPNELQLDTFTTIKSGNDCIIASPAGSGKSTMIALSVIQQLVSAGEESPRALIFVEDKEKVLEMEDIFEKIGQHNELRVYGVHDRGDMEFDKNYISTGIDVLIGTPNRLNEMFTTAGYNVNRLRMFIIDDADVLLKGRHEAKIMRLSNSIAKTQRIIFCDEFTEKVEILAEKMLNDPYIFEFGDSIEEE